MTIPDEFIDQILAGTPSSDTLVLVLSRMKEEGDTGRVIQECLRALDHTPNDLPIRRLLAETYFEAGLIAQAEAVLDRVTAQVNDLMGVFKLQARIYSRQNRPEEAKEALRLYLAHDKDDPEALEILSALELPEDTAMEETPKPISETVKSPEVESGEETGLDKESHLPHISTPTLAEVYFNQGRIQEACDTYERVLTQNPEDERSRKRLEELREILISELPDKPDTTIRTTGKNKKIIAVLEQWLANIREFAEGPSMD